MLFLLSGLKKETIEDFSKEDFTSKLKSELASNFDISSMPLYVVGKNYQQFNEKCFSIIPSTVIDLPEFSIDTGSQVRDKALNDVTTVSD